jgi:hypothetical protein
MQEQNDLSIKLRIKFWPDEERTGLTSDEPYEC